jgi:3-hydroxypropanoate dehydrogenase
MPSVSHESLDQLFLKARTHNGWQDKPVPAELLREIYGIARMGPTSANTQPLRIVFVTSREAKEKLRPALSPGNVEKTMKAPITAIFADDLRFYENLPRLFPHAPDSRSWFEGNQATIAATAFRNATLQAAYFMIVARAKGLDCGPMSGFDNSKVDAAFFPDGRFKSNFICSLGYGTDEQLYPRSPRLEFDEACRIE